MKICDISSEKIGGRQGMKVVPSIYFQYYTTTLESCRVWYFGNWFLVFVFVLCLVFEFSG